MPVADTSQLVSGVAERYASSLFDLAQEAGSADSVGADLARFQALINESDDLKRLIASPVFSAEDQTKAIAAVAAKAGIVPVGDVREGVARIPRIMAEQTSSTAQDLQRGRRSEIDYLNGCIVRKGEALGVPTPANRLLQTLVKIFETR